MNAHLGETNYRFTFSEHVPPTVNLLLQWYQLSMAQHQQNSGSFLNFACLNFPAANDGQNSTVYEEQKNKVEDEKRF